VLLDADLTILTANEADYDTYAAAIRREYAWVSDADFRAGRCCVLERFLARRSIYCTPMMRQHAEARARANLARELVQLAQKDETDQP
jgi:predicted metal-dependent HD superfamily phosphohydrolase